MSVLRVSCPVQSGPVPFLSPDVTVLMLGEDPTQINRQGRQVVNNSSKKGTYLRQATRREVEEPKKDSQDQPGKVTRQEEVSSPEGGKGDRKREISRLESQTSCC